MSLVHHDYVCAHCGHRVRDHLVESSVGPYAGAPECPHCLTAHSVVKMDWVPKIGRMDAGGGPGFVAFDCFDGQNRKIRINSLKQLREVEKQSEIDHKNGIGQPLVFRAFSNEPSKMDESALHKNWNGGEAPTPEAAHRFGSSIRKSMDEPEAQLGPGVTEDSASPLD